MARHRHFVGRLTRGHLQVTLCKFFECLNVFDRQAAALDFK
jgi:hypothetical protein